MIECKTEQHIKICGKEIATVQNAARTIQQLIDENIPELTETIAQPTLVSFQISLENCDPLSWLSQQASTTRLYWSDREASYEVAAAGETDRLFAEGEPHLTELILELQRRLASSSEDIRYYGGLKFDSSSPADHDWKPFGALLFVLPRYEMTKSQHGNTFTINLVIQHGNEVEQQLLAEIQTLQTLCSAAPVSSQPLPIASIRTDSPNQKEWQEIIDKSIQAFDSGCMEKIVLARKTTMVFSEELDPIRLLKQLKDVVNRAFHFYFQFDGTPGFIGATPERLYKRIGETIFSEAVAGTRPRGNSPEADLAFAEDLLNSDKDVREHQFVCKSILDVMDELCTDIQSPAQVSLLKLARVQHLYNKYSATLKKGYGDADLLERIHPTPAVGGVPKKEAIRQIAALEPFDRGWYAGPIGWLSRNESEFAVGIRSALMMKNQLHIYTGAGIVKGSEAESEWEEIENKLGSFLAIQQVNGTENA
ncbi:isochorismate synthase [Chloroherpeton thalassium ATCC 35110]|uniref:Isochorismate synthase MenF n=2 Tax=Chloroherpeton thalassium TaxID=100716 RepID=B3QUU3_CHLT3|nr:isochorismate synthase [Chloroherpeton thalassium ATCC 35110]